MGKKNKIDLIINLRTRCIYKDEILSSPRLGCFNIHHGLLPEYRGTLCDLFALAEQRPAGFTLHKMTQKIDAGVIIKVVEVNQGSERNYVEYLKSTMVPEAEALSNFINYIKENDLPPQGIPNKHDKVTYTKNPTKKQIKNFIREGMLL